MASVPQFIFSNRKAYCPVCQTFVDRIWAVQVESKRKGFTVLKLIACERCAQLPLSLKGSGDAPSMRSTTKGNGMKQLYEIVLCKVLHGSDAGTTRDIVEAGSEAEAIEKARASWKELGVTTRPFFSATEDAANDLEASADLEVAAKAVDAKANGDTKPKKRGPKARKITDEMVVRALELRAKKGLGFHKVAQAISEEFGVEKLSPHNLRIRMMKAKGVDSLNDLAKKSTIAKEVPVPASTKK